MYILKDERFKLNAKTKWCVFLNYSHDEFIYIVYDLVDKKLVRSRDVVFMEGQTIQDILKTDTRVHQCSDCLIDLDPIPLAHVPTEVRDVQDDQHDIGDVDTDSTQVEMGDNVYEQSLVFEVPPEVLSECSNQKVY